MTSKQSLAEIEPRELIPGFKGKFLHTDSMTLVYWDIVAGAKLPEHSHYHEQVVNVLAGEFVLTIAGERWELVAGDVVVIPRNTPHHGEAITDCRILDVFQPAREDYRKVFLLRQPERHGNTEARRTQSLDTHVSLCPL